MYYQKSVSRLAIEKFMNEFNIYIDRTKNTFNDVRISLVVNRSDLAIKVEPTELSFVIDNEYPNCADLALGITNINKSLNFIFEGEPDPETTFLKFSLVVDLVYRGIRNTLIQEQFI
jgi:hypothetical protein